MIVSHGSQKIKGPSYGILTWFFKIGKKKKKKTEQKNCWVFISSFMKITSSLRCFFLEITKIHDSFILIFFQRAKIGDPLIGKY